MNYYSIVAFLLIVVGLATNMNALPVGDDAQLKPDKQQQNSESDKRALNEGPGNAIKQRMDQLGKQIQQLPPLDKLPEYVIAKMSPF